MAICTLVELARKGLNALFFFFFFYRFRMFEGAMSCVKLISERKKPGVCKAADLSYLYLCVFSYMPTPGEIREILRSFGNCDRGSGFGIAVYSVFHKGRRFFGLCYR